jgi:hypothetical protein
LLGFGLGQDYPKPSYIIPQSYSNVKFLGEQFWCVMKQRFWDVTEMGQKLVFLGKRITI